MPFLASAFGVFMLRQFFLTVPKDLHDAAKIDGAGNWRYLWRILVPLSKGAIGAFAIFAFLSAWNQYLWPLIITKTHGDAHPSDRHSLLHEHILIAAPTGVRSWPARSSRWRRPCSPF